MSRLPLTIFLAVTLLIGLVSSALPSLPTSCPELAKLGNTIAGFYTVINKTTNTTETVYCDFKQKPGQTFTTNAPKPAIFFYATTMNSTGNGVGNIKFDTVRTNVGSAFNGKTGVFTAPVSGYYAFFFDTIKTASYNNPMVTLVTYSATNIQNVADSFAQGTGYEQPLSGINGIFQLKAGDNVALMMYDTSTLGDFFVKWQRYNRMLLYSLTLVTISCSVQDSSQVRK